jgi:hypothetical protein
VHRRSAIVTHAFLVRQSPYSTVCVCRVNWLRKEMWKGGLASYHTGRGAWRC